jgi:hypothetical protein
MHTQINKEEVYDNEIHPLMAKILEICMTNKIAFIASFSIPTPEDPDLACSSALLGKEFGPTESLRTAWRAIRPSAPGPLLVLRTENADGSATLTAIAG